MSTGIIIAIIVVVVLVIAVIAAVASPKARVKRRERELGQRRERVVGEHREQAEERSLRAREAEKQAQLAQAGGPSARRGGSPRDPRQRP
jgi:predicted Holliday junction resolvase-like endonuclease